MGIGVDGVLDKLLDYGGGTLNDFASGNLIRHVIGQQADTVHEIGRWSVQLAMGKSGALGMRSSVGVVE